MIRLMVYYRRTNNPSHDACIPFAGTYLGIGTQSFFEKLSDFFFLNNIGIRILI